jgi:hypothetical protein
MRSVRSMLYFLCLKILSICLNLVGFISESHAGHENARIAQLVEHDLAKVGVAGSSPVSRSTALNVVLAINFSLRTSSCVWAVTCCACLLGVALLRPRVQYTNVKGCNTCQGGGIGRHARLKILWAFVRAGSSPAPGTQLAEIFAR